jgi:hypothetical protein
MFWNTLFVVGCFGQQFAARLILTARKPCYGARYMRIFRQPSLLLFALLTVLSTLLSVWSLLKAAPSSGAHWHLWSPARAHTHTTHTCSTTATVWMEISPHALFLVLCALGSGVFAVVRHIRFGLDEVAYPTVWETRVWMFRRRLASAVTTALRLGSLCAVSTWLLYEVLGQSLVQLCLTVVQWCVPVCLVPALTPSASLLDVDLLLHAFRLLCWVFLTRELSLHLLEIFLTEQVGVRGRECCCEGSKRCADAERERERRAFS